MDAFSGEDPGAASAQGRAVLVVDDDLGALETLVDILSLKGYHVDAVDSGAAAVAAVQRTPYRIVLMDVQMPGMNGVDALEQISVHSPGVPVALMTAFTQHPLLDESRRARAVEVISKPLDLDHVLALVANPG